MLNDGSRPLNERLVHFYQDYADSILTYDFTRLLLLAGLKGLDFHTRLFARLREEMFPPVIDALRRQFGRAGIDVVPPTEWELETVWGLHASIYYLGVRQHVFDLTVPKVDKAVAVKVAAFLGGVDVILSGDRPAPTS